jgi:hypothetical protein
MKEFLARTGASTTDDIEKYGFEKEFFASFEENLPLIPRKKAEAWWSTTYLNRASLHRPSLPDPTAKSSPDGLTPYGTPTIPGHASP